jgi:hypothetical protein
MIAAYEGLTSDEDRGRLHILAQLTGAQGAYADVGIFDGEKHPEGDDEYTLAQIYAVQEFGTKPGTEPVIPERSTIRKLLREQGPKINRLFDSYLRRVAEGKTDLISALTAFGEIVAGMLRKEITDLKDPPKADATLQREGEGFDNPLIWTGAMRNAVRSQIVVDLPGRGSVKRMTAKGVA